METSDERLATLRLASLAQGEKGPEGNRRASNELAPAREGFLSRRYVLLCLLILALATGLRFYRLGDKPLHHDESMHVYYSYEFMKYLSPWQEGGQRYEYNPMMHGPLLYHLTALGFFICGDSDASSRYTPALFGVLMIGLLLLWRPFIGAGTALLAGLLVATAPVALYVSRYARMDIFAAFFNLAMITAALYYLRRRRPIYVYLFFAAASLTFCTKEIAFITFFVFFTYLALRFCVAYIFGSLKGLRTELAPLWRVDLLVNGACIALVIYFFFFSSAFTHPRGVLHGFYKGVAYWLGQHGVKRGDQPLFYYLALLPANELMVCLLTLGAGFMHALRRLGALIAGGEAKSGDALRLFLFYWTALALVIYSMAGERMPWLGLHILTPAYIIAAIAVRELRDHIAASDLRLYYGGLAMIVLVPLFILHGRTSYGLSFLRAADPAETMVYTQSTPDCPIVADLVKEISRRSTGGDTMPLVIEDTCSWPFSWYLRHYARAHPPVLDKGTSEPVVITADDNTLVRGEPRSARNEEILGERYHHFNYRLRAWWQPSRRANTFSLLSYLVKRKVWNTSGFGSYDFVLWVRKDVADKAFAAPYSFTQARRYR